MTERPQTRDKLDVLLTDQGLAAPETLARARLVSSETGERFDSVLTRLGFVSEQLLAQTIATSMHLRIAQPSDFPHADITGDRISPRFLRDQRAVPLADSGTEIELALVNPMDAYPAEAVGFALGRPVRPVVALASDVEAALDRIYGTAATETGADDDIDEDDLERLKDMTSEAPAIRAVNRLITRAVELRASDIHIEPTEDALAVRFRIDGAMREMAPLPNAMKLPLVSRVKIMSGLNIAEKRLPQDGRLRLAVRGHDIDLRVATSPTIHGESVVLRLLDRSNLALEFVELGFDDDTRRQFTSVLSQPHGIVLVTGPTGSGKTTTLYASLAALNTPERKILTIEDPIEYRLAGISQTQVAPGIGLSFAAALRSFLRQDPDVMMVGEIRDLETAQVAVQAALTGHMILSTLHTNTAAGAVARLLDMEVEPFLLTSTIKAVLAQRLVRRLCPDCREPYTPAAETLRSAGLADGETATAFYRATGCHECGGTGYHGRLALLELLMVDDVIAQLVIARAEARDLHRAALANGMRPMLSDGVIKARAGLTTIEEVLRVTREG